MRDRYLDEIGNPISVESVTLIEGLPLTGSLKSTKPQKLCLDSLKVYIVAKPVSGE